ncbi:hypothetical protein Bca4012_009935 [Brassica carinata]
MSLLENDRPLLTERIYEEHEEEEAAYDESEKVHIVRDEDDNERDLEYGVGCGGAPPFSWRKLWLFTGPGFLMSIAFLDPGNLEGDLQAGAVAGYSLLWLLMWATAMGLLVQLLSARLGVATGRHLAELCREEYPTWAGMVLWVMAELALIGSDIQEVIGSAIAIQILTNGIFPLWVGVVITALDRKLEAVFAVLIGTMGVAFAWMFGQAKPSGSELLVGILVPKLSSRTIQKAVGVVGCVIMPHNVFLHSALVQSREVDKRQKYRVQEAINYYTIESTIALTVSFMINLFVTTVFAKGFYNTDIADSIGLVNAGQYLQDKYGGGLFPILYIWGIGLLAAGQSSTITGTYAGQFIMGGFLNFKMKKWLRALITRSCAIIPTIIVALVFDSSEAKLDVLNEWLNVLQSIQIPFALIPLLFLVSKEQIMGSFKIGPLYQTVAWLVAALVIMINGYLLVEFFSSEVGDSDAKEEGWVIGSEEHQSWGDSDEGAMLRKIHDNFSSGNKGAAYSEKVVSSEYIWTTLMVAGSWHRNWLEEILNPTTDLPQGHPLKEIAAATRAEEFPLGSEMRRDDSLDFAKSLDPIARSSIQIRGIETYCICSGRQKGWRNMFVSRSMRNAGSARAARRLPVPTASSPDTSYSPTKPVHKVTRVSKKMKTHKSFIWSLLGVIMITGVSWIPKGAPKAMPDDAETHSKEKIDELIQNGTLKKSICYLSNMNDEDNRMEHEIHSGEVAHAKAVSADQREIGNVSGEALSRDRTRE